MSRLVIALLTFAVLPVGMLSAAEIVSQQRTITRTYVSPGASGSVEEYSRQQGSSGYGGYTVPDNRYDNGNRYQNNSSTQTRGNVQQSIEYPGIGEFQRQPGSRSVQDNRR
ncbi:hypothetical protein [Pseudomonas turukhanskensis]|uniref:Secreted protein n=1 Tax=Pseudomonas turukhanskensis TaxID=1806536 RepID=A0A9W6K7L6_9PSED|nr:hypothetical protein [Pseudomonas turukhanskensis]GLK89703.1 hypothetical protein GCM10017655_27650 [Pseudomonas turukhanskensis]